MKVAVLWHEATESCLLQVANSMTPQSSWDWHLSQLFISESPSALQNGHAHLFA